MKMFANQDNEKGNKYISRKERKKKKSYSRVVDRKKSSRSDQIL